MARRISNRTSRNNIPTFVGAGLTEYYYLKHLKTLDSSYQFRLPLRYFGRETIHEIEKNIEEILSINGTAYCVFDTDVTTWDQKEEQRLIELKRKYADNENVYIFTSLPSIEYWFLLHFENTNRFMATSHEAMNALRKHIPDFDKNTQFLEKDQWVRLLLADNRLATACERAETFGNNKTPDDTISYSELYKLFKLLINKS